MEIIVRKYYSTCCNSNKLWETFICKKCLKPAQFLTEVDSYEKYNPDP